MSSKMEHRCPYCNGQIDIGRIKNPIKLEGSDADFTFLECPTCGVALYVSDSLKFGIMADFVDSDDIKTDEYE